MRGYKHLAQVYKVHRTLWKAGAFWGTDRWAVHREGGVRQGRSQLRGRYEHSVWPVRSVDGCIFVRQTQAEQDQHWTLIGPGKYEKRWWEAQVCMCSSYLAWNQWTSTEYFVLRSTPYYWSRRDGWVGISQKVVDVVHFLLAVWVRFFFFWFSGQSGAKTLGRWVVPC